MKRTHLLLLALCAALLAGCSPAGSGSASTSAGGASSSSSSSGSSSSEIAQVSPPSSAPAVWADWSKLGQGGSETFADIGGRFYPNHTKNLIPRDDYGTLIPFVGAQVYPFLEYEYNGIIESHSDYLPTALYGLMTRDGRVVMDTRCTGIYPLEYYYYDAASDETATCPLPVYQLSIADPELGNPSSGELIALAATDGRWATDFLYWGALAFPGGVLAGDGAHLALLDADTGDVLRSWTWADFGFSEPVHIPWSTADAESTAQWLGEQVYLGYLDDNYETALFLDPDSSQTTISTAEQLRALFDVRYRYNPWTVEEPVGVASFVMQRGAQRYTLPIPEGAANAQYLYANIVHGLAYIGSYGDTGWDWVCNSATGEILFQGSFIQMVSDRLSSDAPTLIHVHHPADRQTIYHPDGTPLLTLAWRSTDIEMYPKLYDGILAVQHGENTYRYYDLQTGECVFSRTFLPAD